MPCVALLTHSAVTCNIHPHSCFLFPCGFLLSILKVKVAQLCPTLWKSYGLYSPWNSPGQNTGVGSLFLLQGIFPTSGSNPGLPHCRRILYQLRHKEWPRLLEWVAYFFSSRSSPTQELNWDLLHCWRRKWQPTPVFLSGETHGQKSLAGYNPWGCKESDTTEWLTTTAPALQGDSLPTELSGKPAVYFTWAENLQFK